MRFDPANFNDPRGGSAFDLVSPAQTANAQALNERQADQTDTKQLVQESQFGREQQRLMYEEEMARRVRASEFDRTLMETQRTADRKLGMEMFKTQADLHYKNQALEKEQVRYEQDWELRKDQHDYDMDNKDQLLLERKFKFDVWKADREKNKKMVELARQKQMSEDGAAIEAIENEKLAQDSLSKILAMGNDEEYEADSMAAPKKTSKTASKKTAAKKDDVFGTVFSGSEDESPVPKSGGPWRSGYEEPKVGTYGYGPETDPRGPGPWSDEMKVKAPESSGSGSGEAVDSGVNRSGKINLVDKFPSPAESSSASLKPTRKLKELQDWLDNNEPESSGGARKYNQAMKARAELLKVPQNKAWAISEQAKKNLNVLNGSLEVRTDAEAATLRTRYGNIFEKLEQGKEVSPSTIKAIQEKIMTEKDIIVGEFFGLPVAAQKSTSDIRKEWISNGGVKDYNESITEYTKFKELIASANIQDKAGKSTGADDIAIVFSFMKALDPTSVVRDGEFIMAAKSHGVVEQNMNLINQVNRGNILTVEQRIDMERVAANAVRGHQIKQRNRISVVQQRLAGMARGGDGSTDLEVMSQNVFGSRRPLDEFKDIKSAAGEPTDDPEKTAEYNEQRKKALDKVSKLPVGSFHKWQDEDIVRVKNADGGWVPSGRSTSEFTASGNRWYLKDNLPETPPSAPVADPWNPTSKGWTADPAPPPKSGDARRPLGTKKPKPVTVTTPERKPLQERKPRIGADRKEGDRRLVESSGKIEEYKKFGPFGTMRWGTVGNEEDYEKDADGKWVKK